MVLKNLLLSDKRLLIAKCITWRIIASGSVLMLTYIFTNSFLTSFNIFISHAILNTFLYYYHESFWENIKLKVMKQKNV
jgi:uncharacterized membrane protein